MGGSAATRLGLCLALACGGELPSADAGVKPADSGGMDEHSSDAGVERRDAAETVLYPVGFRLRVPSDTPAMPPVHVAGSFQGWDPAAAGGRLERLSPTEWELTLRLPPGPITYKYARADWSRVEKGAGGEEIEDRRAVVAGPLELDDRVASWADRPARPSTLTGDIRSVEALDRIALVYLPPGYEDQPDRRYPVLYLFDGQNVFDDRTAFAGEWEADEAAERLIRGGEIEPVILVALEHGGTRRTAEYTPWRDESYDPPGGGGQEHLRLLIDDLKRKVDERFRTRPGPEHTAICGASLGGLMAAYAQVHRPDVFGRAAALSPSVWWKDRELTRFVAGSPPGWIYADMGAFERGGMPGLEALRDALVAAGWVEGEHLFVLEIQGAGHDEAAWRARFPDILRRLFPPTGR